MSSVASIFYVGIVALLGVIAGVAYLMRSGGARPDAAPSFGAPGAPAAGGPPLPGVAARSVLFFVRVEGREDEGFAREMASRYGRLTSAAQMREAALDLVRLAPTSTHVWAGPAGQAPAGPALARSGLEGGVIVGLVVHGTRALDTVADDRDLRGLVGSLRKVAAWTEADFAGGALQLAEGRVDAQAPALVAVRKETRPGHQLCRYCDEAFPAHESVCPNCGGVAYT